MFDLAPVVDTTAGPPNAPLPLEELREKDGKPVWMNTTISREAAIKALTEERESIAAKPEETAQVMAYGMSVCINLLKELPACSAGNLDPLTLDELREMDGEPVWVCEPNGANGVWGLVDLEYQMIRLHGGGLAIWENNDKSWLAYRRKLEGSQ